MGIEGESLIHCVRSQRRKYQERSGTHILGKHGKGGVINNYDGKRRKKEIMRGDITEEKVSFSKRQHNSKETAIGVAKLRENETAHEKNSGDNGRSGGPKERKKDCRWVNPPTGEKGALEEMVEWTLM